MALLLAIIVGVSVGFVTGVFLNGRPSLGPIYAGFGLGGAVFAGAAYFFASGDRESYITLGGFLSQILGALVAVLLFCLIFHVLPKAVRKPASRGHVDREP